MSVFRRRHKGLVAARPMRRRLQRAGLLLLVPVLIAGGVGYRFMGHGQAQSLPENCFSSPGACGYPDPNYNNDLGSTAVGVADCGALPTFNPANLPDGTYYSGSGSLLEITGNNVTINRMNMGDFDIYVSSGVNDFTLDNSCLQGGDGTEDSIGINISAGATNTTIENSTISGLGSNVASSSIVGGDCVPGAGVSNGALGVAIDNSGTNTVMNGLYVYDAGGGTPGTGSGNDATLENSYELINTIPACEHDEAIYYSSLSITLHHNVLFNEEDQTAAVFGDSDTACANQLTMTDNFVAGGDYVVYPCANSSSVGTSTMDITNNRFARCLTTPFIAGGDECSGSGLNGSDSHGYYPNGGFFSVAAYYYSGAGQTWSNNYWDDNLDQVNINGSSGSPVADPGPAVALTGPSPGGSVSSTVTITATATTTAPATVHDVQFQVDSTNIPNCDPTLPTSNSTYTCSLDTTGLSNASHTVQVIATDSNNETATSQETLTVQNTTPTTYTIWQPTDAPVNSDTSSDPSAINIGTKFQSDEAGYIVGVRFYKGVDNTGTHIGTLWTSGGTALDSVTFSNETASGWQQAYFSTPVAISANTTYVISYLAPNGNYAADHNYFNSSLSNGPLTALQNDDVAGDGGNGAYDYNSTPGLPDQSYLASSYWVDAMFSTVQSSPPTVSFVAPTGGTTVNGTKTITANVTGNFGLAVNDVQFQVDGTDIPSCDPSTPVTGSTYECSVWNTDSLLNGTHVVQAVATDAQDQINTNGEIVTVNNPAAAVNLHASPTTIAAGQSSELIWSSTNATSCTASGAWSGSQATSNSSGYTISPTTTSTYTLTCNGPGGQSTPASAVVTVATPSPAPAAGTTSTATTTHTQTTSATTTAVNPSSTATATPSSSTQPESSGATSVPVHHGKSMHYLMVLAFGGGAGLCLVVIGLIVYHRRSVFS